MRAAEKMASRIILVERLTRLDDNLVAAFAKPATYSIADRARALFADRRILCRELEAVGYHPWGQPIDVNESKVS